MNNHAIESSRGNEHPLPLSHYIDLHIASRSTLWRWNKEGLKILKVGGRSYISPAEITRFMEAKHEETVGVTERTDDNRGLQTNQR